MKQLIRKILSPFFTLKGKHVTKREIDILLVDEKSQTAFYKSREKYFQYRVKQAVNKKAKHETYQVKYYYQGETMEAVGFFKGADIYKVPNPTEAEIEALLNAVISEYDLIRFDKQAKAF